MNVKKLFLSKISITIAVALSLTMLLYRPITMYLSEDGIHIKIENQKEDINQVLAVVFHSSLGDTVLYEDLLLKAGTIKVKADRPLYAEGAISIVLGETELYRIGYIDSSTSKVFIHLKVLDVNLDTSELSLRIKVYNAFDYSSEHIVSSMD